MERDKGGIFGFGILRTRKEAKQKKYQPVIRIDVDVDFGLFDLQGLQQAWNNQDKWMGEIERMLPAVFQGVAPVEVNVVMRDSEMRLEKVRRK